MSDNIAVGQSCTVAANLSENRIRSRSLPPYGYADSLKTTHAASIGEPIGNRVDTASGSKSSFRGPRNFYPRWSDQFVEKLQKGIHRAREPDLWNGYNEQRKQLILFLQDYIDGRKSGTSGEHMGGREEELLVLGQRFGEIVLDDAQM